MATTIVAGYDGSPASETAVRWAAVEADRPRERLRLTYALPVSFLSSPLGIPSVPLPTEMLREAAERLLAESIAGQRDKYPDVTLRTELVHGTPHDALLAAGRSAEMLVVGSRGRGAFRGLLLGSTSRALVHHPPCPVAVVR